MLLLLHFLTATMHAGITEMLGHRGVGTSVVSAETGEVYSAYRLQSSLTVVEFHQSVKKSDATKLAENRAGAGPLLVAHPGISAPARVVLEEARAECVHIDIYEFPRLRSGLLPVYRRLPEPEARALEHSHRCTRAQWPVLCAQDPVARYYGLAAGTVVEVTEPCGIVDYRHVA